MLLAHLNFWISMRFGLANGCENFLLSKVAMYMIGPKY